MHVIHANDLYRFVSGVGAGNPGSGPSVPTASDSLQKSAAKSSGPRISTGTLFLRTRTLSNRVKSIGFTIGGLKPACWQLNRCRSGRPHRAV
jgi:hypothetical protein